MYEFAPGSTGRSVQFYLRRDDDGKAKTGLTATSPGAYCGYTRSGQTAAAIPLAALASAAAAWQAGGFFEIDATNSRGLYRLDLPDAALAAGVPFFSVCIGFAGVLDEGALVLLRNPVNNVGAGAVSWTITVNNANTGLPLPGALVWVSTDAAGLNVVAGALTTNLQGQVTFQLDAGTYYLWAKDAGYAGANPTAFTVA